MFSYLNTKKKVLHTVKSQEKTAHNKNEAYQNDES